MQKPEHDIRYHYDRRYAYSKKTSIFIAISTAIAGIFFSLRIFLLDSSTLEQAEYYEKIFTNSILGIGLILASIFFTYSSIKKTKTK